MTHEVALLRKNGFWAEKRFYILCKINLKNYNNCKEIGLFGRISQKFFFFYALPTPWQNASFWFR